MVSRRLLVLPFAVSLVVAALVMVYFVARAGRRLVASAYGADDTWLGVAGGLALAAVVLVIALRWTTFLVLSVASHFRPRPKADTNAWPFVSVFVPAFNESATIEPALRSLLRLDYPRYEILVIDDGSTDDTFARAKAFEGDHGPAAVRVFRKPNGGKWSAHNFAFHRSAGEFVLCLDADSQVEAGALKLLVARLADPRVAAVSGQIRVRNRVNLLTRLQALEYVMANGTLRLAQSSTGTVLVVPGPIGLFRRSVLEEVYLRYGWIERPRPGEVAGPYERDTFAEDFDLSLTILALGHRIDYEPAAVSHTKAPDWPFALLNQRYRWCRGTIQVLRKYAGRAWRDRRLRQPTLIAWVAFTYVFEILMLPLVYTTTFGFIIAVLLTGDGVEAIVSLSAAFLVLNLNAAALYALIHRDTPHLLWVLPLFDLYQGGLLNSGWLVAVFDEVRGARMKW